MVLAVDFSGLSAWADVMATILLLELCVLLAIIAVLIGVLAYGARWIQMHVVPLLNNTVPVANQALQVTNQSTDRVVRGVAEVYGLQSAVETAGRVLLFGKNGARQTTRAQSALQSTALNPAQPTATPSAGSQRPRGATGYVGPADPHAQAPIPEPRQPDHSYDNMAPNA
jgi:hypothetical protein